VGVKVTILLAIAGALALAATPAQAQRTRFQGVSQCTRFAVAQFGRRDPQFRRFLIEHASVREDRFSDFVGHQYVPTIYFGKAIYETSTATKKVRFICLHGGTVKGPVFVYALPD